MRSDPVFAIAQVMVLVKIMLTVLLLDPRSFDTFTLPKSVAAHTTSLVIAALLIWLLARHGRAILFWSPVHVGAGALLLAFALATPFALDPTVALFGSFKRYLGLTQMLDNLFLYLAVGILFRDLRSLRLLAGVGLGVAVPVLGYAVIQRAGLDPLRFTQAETRLPISTMGNPDIAGAFVSVVGVTALSIVFLAKGAVVTWWRVAVGLIGAGCIAVLYATGVRAGVLAIGGGWMAAMLLSQRMPQLTRVHRLGSIGIAAALALGVLMSPIAARLAPSYLQTDLAFISRVDIWRAATIAFLERPVLGLGPDNFVAAYPSRRTPASLRTGELQNSTHDIWLYAATSAGIVGLLSLLLFVTLAVDRALRLARQGYPAALALVPLAAYLAQAQVNVNEIVVDWMFWTSAGVIAGASGIGVRHLQRRGQQRRSLAIGLAGLAAAFLITIFGMIPRLAAGEALLATEAYANAGQSPEAIRYGQDAVNADPRRAEMWSSYGVALQRAGESAAAVTTFNVAAERQPWLPLSWKNLAITWITLGNPAAAHVSATRAVTADPYDGEARDLLARLSYDRGDFTRAAAEGERALEYRDPLASTYFTAISAYVQLKDFGRAEVLAREAVSRFDIPRLRLQFAAILADEGKTAEALAVLDPLVRQQPPNADAQRLRELLEKR